MTRLYAWGALGLGAVLALIGAAAWGYHAGTQAERQRQAAQWADSLLASVERAADTGVALAGVGHQLAEALADARHARLSAAAGVPGERDAALRAGSGGPAEPDPGR